MKRLIAEKMKRDVITARNLTGLYISASVSHTVRPWLRRELKVMDGAGCTPIVVAAAYHSSHRMLSMLSMLPMLSVIAPLTSVVITDIIDSTDSSGHR